MVHNYIESSKPSELKKPGDGKGEAVDVMRSNLANRGISERIIHPA